MCVDGGFRGYLCLKQAAADVAHKSVGWVCPHPRGDQAGWDWKSPGSTGCPGRLHALRGVSFIQGGYLSRHMFLLAAEFRAGRSSRHTGQAQLSRLQAGQADGQSFQSFPVNMAEEGATPFTSPREALDHHPTAHEAQCRLQVSMPME